MEGSPKVFAPEFAESMKLEAERLLKDVMEAVNQAPDGDWIAGSEEQVRDLMGNFRKRVYEEALQRRIDAAEAAFSPSADDTSRSSDEPERREAQTQ
ncbi:MAG: hypothetical protein ACREEE_05870 [Dongiaceae bacterium]